MRCKRKARYLEWLQGVFKGAPLPNSRAAKNPVPPKTPPAATSGFPAPTAAGIIVPSLRSRPAEPGKIRTFNTQAFNTVLNVKRSTGTLTITKDNGNAVFANPLDYALHTVGLYKVKGDGTTSDGAEITFQSGPSTGRIAATAGNNQGLNKDFYIFKNIKQVEGHTYTYDISTDANNKTTYSLKDNTTGGPPEIATNTGIQWTPQRGVINGDEFHNPTVNPIKRFEFTPISTTLTTTTGQVFNNPPPTSNVCKTPTGC